MRRCSAKASTIVEGSTQPFVAPHPNDDEKDQELGGREGAVIDLS